MTAIWLLNVPELAPPWAFKQYACAGQEGKMSLALESVLMSVLHAPVMESLAAAHAGADAAIHGQAQEHHKQKTQVLVSRLL